MSSIQKILKKANQSGSQGPEVVQVEPLEQTCLKAVELSAYNPTNVQFTNMYFPGSHDTMQKCPVPSGLFLAPYPDPSTPQSQIRADKLPRCLYCKAYMNMHNRFVVNGNSFVCSVCNKQSPTHQDYYCKLEGGVRTDRDEKPELSHASYTAVFPEHLAPIGRSDCFVLIIDISRDAKTYQMLEYGIIAIKEVLKREEFDNLTIFLFAYDTHLSFYDFGGSQPTRIVTNIEEQNPFVCFPYSLSQVREQLFEALDSLEQAAQFNQDKSEFFKCFDLVHDLTKGYSPKYFVFQTSEHFIYEKFAAQLPQGKDKDISATHHNKSVFQPINKDFFNKYVADWISRGISMSLFCFEQKQKNLKVLADTFKLSNSQMFVYTKNSQEELNKFYYELYGLLQTPYLSNFSLQAITSPGWLLHGIYSNLCRTKDALQCKFNRLDSRKRVAFHLTINQKSQIPDMWLVLQIITTYVQHDQYKLHVNTYVVPLTDSISHLTTSINFQVLSALICKIHLALMRLESSVVVRSKLVKMMAQIYDLFDRIYGGIGNFPDQVLTFFKVILSYLKSDHSYPDKYEKLSMDRLLCERNFLQCTGVEEVNTFFMPYLFKISDLPDESCTLDSEEHLIYPPTCDLVVSSCEEGVFLMDCCTKLILYVAAFASQEVIYDLFGTTQLPKANEPVENIVANQNTGLKTKLFALISELRTLRSYQYIPLYLASAGRLQEFYSKFTGEKHSYTRNLEIGFTEFLNVLEQQRNAL